MKPPYTLKSGSPVIGQRDPITRRNLQVGDLVKECAHGHVSLKESWEFLGGKCPLCDEADPSGVKDDDPKGRGHRRPPERSTTGVVLGSTALTVIGIGTCAMVAIGGIIAASLQSNNTPSPEPPVRVVETVVVEVPVEGSGDDSPDFVVITATPRRATSIPEPTDRPTRTPKPETETTCPGSRSPRLEVGESGRVTITNGIPVRVRSGPSKSDSIIDQIGEGTVFDVIDGPECSSGWWWKIRTGGGLVGWVLESSSDYGYHVEPYP